MILVWLYEKKNVFRNYFSLTTGDFLWSNWIRLFLERERDDNFYWFNIIIFNQKISSSLSSSLKNVAMFFLSFFGVQSESSENVLRKKGLFLGVRGWGICVGGSGVGGVLGPVTVEASGVRGLGVGLGGSELEEAGLGGFELEEAGLRGIVLEAGLGSAAPEGVGSGEAELEWAKLVILTEWPEDTWPGESKL
jgi:hypothetical protein